MSVKVELDNACPACWVPAVSQMEGWLTAALSQLEGRAGPVSISICIVNEAEAARLNSTYRGRDKATNVLSFECPLPSEVVEQLDARPLGDLAVCAPVLEAEARAQGKSLEAHWAHLLTHGFLHLNGYDHETTNEADRMEAIEISVLAALGFSNPYVDEAGHADS